MTKFLIGLFVCGLAGGIAGYYGGPMSIVAVFLAETGMAIILIK